MFEEQEYDSADYMDQWFIQAEYGVLAVLLMNNDQYDRVAPFLRPEHFSTTIGQKVYAEMLGISESTVSRRKGEGHFADIAKELSVLGLQVVPPEAVVVSRHYLQSVETLADIGLRAERCRPGPLGWD